MIATIVFLIASFVWFETVVVDYFTELGITQKFDPVNGLTNHFDYDIWPLPWFVQFTGATLGDSRTM